MSRDNAPRERQIRDLERKTGRRVSHDRFLIVCEGSRTEPMYLREIRVALRLHTASIEVRPCETGTSPRQVVEYARTLFENGDPHKRIQKRAFEKIFAVFDRDQHDSYFDALRMAESLDGKLRNDSKSPVSFTATASVPNFELWLLLHFQDVLAPIERNEVIRRLRSDGRLPHYSKGQTGLYTQTQPMLGEAMLRASALCDRFTAFDAPQPYTGFGELVRLLTGLRS